MRRYIDLFKWYIDINTAASTTHLPCAPHFHTAPPPPPPSSTHAQQQEDPTHNIVRRYRDLVRLGWTNNPPSSPLHTHTTAGPTHVVRPPHLHASRAAPHPLLLTQQQQALPMLRRGGSRLLTPRHEQSRISRFYSRCTPATFPCPVPSPSISASRCLKLCIWR